MSCALGLAAWLLRVELRDVEPDKVLRAMRAVRPQALTASAVFTALSFGCLAAEEWCAFRFRRVERPLGWIARRSFVANAVSGLVGFGLASGTAIRIRIYASLRLSAREFAAIVLLYSASTWLSGVVTFALGLLASIPAVAAATGWPAIAVAGMGAVLLSPAALWFTTFRRRGRGAPPPPDARTRAAGLMSGIGDWACSAGALYVLSGGDVAGFAPFLAIFTAGSLIGALAGVPASVGVLEAAVLGWRAHSLVHETTAALILYRAIYVVAPAVLAAAGLAAQQAFRLGSKTAARTPAGR